MNPVIAMLRALAGKIVVPQVERKLRRFEHQLQNARTVQRELLFQKIRRCEGSQFGRDHHFASIKTLEDFRRNVPIRQYDYYQPYIDQVTHGNVEAMFPAGEKLLMYTLTSGTTAIPKLIPINKIWMDEYRRGWQVWGIKAFLDHHNLFYSKLTGIAGNWDMRRTPTDHPCGMASGLSARLQSPLLQMMYCVPASAYEIDDVAAKYYTCLRMSIAEPKVGLFLTATPATVVNFAKLGNQYRDKLIRDIHDGTLSAEFDVPASIRKEVTRRIKRGDPARARELEAIVERTGTLYPKDYWNMSLVGCWIGGTVGSYARHISHYYADTPCRDIGLLCSEGRFTVPMQDGLAAGPLEVASHYYEFIPEDEIESPQPTVLECHELEEGKNYFILLTTSSGLYRYNIYDVLKCVGFVGETPVLEFMNKGQRFSDMEGEKIAEVHLVKAVSDVAEEMGITITGFTSVPVRPSESNEDSTAETAPEETDQSGNQVPPYYAVMLEEQDIVDRDLAVRFLQGVDRWLSDHNVMYQGKRADNYLGPPRLVKIPTGSWQQFDQSEVKRRGVGEDHYKHPCLVLDEAFLGRFEQLDEIIPPSPAS